MRMSRAVSLSAALVFKPKPLAGALAAALLMCSSAYAASFGHSRLVSAPGQPLHVNVSVTQLSADDLRSFSAVPAPAAAWQQAGLTPPVDLATMQISLVDGYAPGSKLIQVRSDQAFNKPVADILLDVRTATGQQRFQVSLLTHAGLDAVTPAATGSMPTGSLGASQAAPTKAIHVKRGDTMFGIAQRHAVPGVTIYQMMIALQRANPQAFIHENINLVKAGASLNMPGHDALTAISDREARRLFQQQAQAFAQYRQRAAANTSAVAEGGGAMGVVTESSSAAAPAADQPRDQLRLSGGQASSAEAGNASSANASDDAVATNKGIEDSQQRVSQLQDNVKTLNEALQSQGLAASSLIIDSAKGIGESIAASGNESTATSGNASDSETGGSGGGSNNTPGSGTDASDGGTNNTSGGGQGQAAENGSSAGQSGTAGQAGTTGDSASGAGGQGAASAVAGQDSSSGGSGSGNNSTGNADASGSASGSSTGGGATADDSAAPGSTTAGSNNTGGAATGNAAVGGANGVSAGGSGGNGAGGGQDNASADNSSAAQTAESISTKAEQSVSWFQEHMLGVITGLLAFIVLVIAWLLRRANAARDTGRESNAGPITEAMVKEKLDQINLELEQEEAPTRSRPDTR
ncbi:hypothetical protein PT7_1287 [Pusillimonas sp. T7-7]|uniref:type IV pilus assembly protein FimV n=1 Tax=Pusillimonas sp. (strain T7-7) TaxID=1007105 RepID=UPI00020845E9|nr:FimV/HubP family polar landmark protein [Pusillimonas sp. T7-7]AEC19827.1 hypothetical protein PT7_1287 [Pusillimonas sp. T7-7]